VVAPLSLTGGVADGKDFVGIGGRHGNSRTMDKTPEYLQP
jgi:hypothetical protein